MNTLNKNDSIKNQMLWMIINIVGHIRKTHFIDYPI